MMITDRHIYLMDCLKNRNYKWGKTKLGNNLENLADDEYEQQVLRN